MYETLFHIKFCTSELNFHYYRYIQNLSLWIQNNWRSFHTVINLPKHRKKSPLDVLWHRNKEAVIDELKSILKEKGRLDDEPTNNDIFIYRVSAAKRVYDQLNPDERAKIDKESSEGNIESPPEVQRRYKCFPL